MIQDNTRSLFTGLGGGLDFKITHDVSSFCSEQIMIPWGYLGQSVA